MADFEVVIKTIATKANLWKLCVGCINTWLIKLGGFSLEVLSAKEAALIAGAIKKAVYSKLRGGEHLFSPGRPSVNGQGGSQSRSGQLEIRLGETEIAFRKGGVWCSGSARFVVPYQDIIEFGTARTAGTAACLGRFGPRVPAPGAGVARLFSV